MKSVSWCATWIPLIKLAQAICHVLVIVMFIDGREQWFFYNNVFLIAFLAIFFSLFSILLRFFEMEKTGMSFHVTDLVCNVALAILSFVFSAVLLWDVWNMRHGPAKFKYHTRLPPVNIGLDAWIRRCVVVSSSLLLAGVLYIITYLKLKK